MPLLDGSSHTYVYLDNAASTPALRGVKQKIEDLLEWYSSVHRGSGYKSLVTTHAYERAHEITLNFVGGDPQRDCVIFGKNTTEAINTLAEVFPWSQGDVVISTLMEHHSNDLPWRAHAHVIHSGVDATGALDMDELQHQLEIHADHVRLVAVTGASNVTGFAPPIHQIAEMAHHAGALILADCAQLAPHRAIDMGPHDNPAHIDFVSLSGHKMYAPYGGGALIGPSDFFSQHPPAHRGGGTIEVVSLNEVYWAGPPERDEAGSPNVVGAVAMAASMRILSSVGMPAVAEHEKELTAYTLELFKHLPGLHVYGSSDPARLDDRVGVISIDLGGLHHGLVAAILSFEAGIGVRNGCFCAHPYLLHMLGVQGEAYEQFKLEVLSHDRRNVPGLVRISFGCYNTKEEVDYLVEWLGRILEGKYQGTYYQEQESGSFFPQGYDAQALNEVFDL